MTLSKTAFSARDQHVLSFLHWVHHFFNSFQQSARVCPKSKTALLARDQHVFTFSHCADHFFSDFQQRASVCSKQRFFPEISTYCHFCIGCTTFQLFSAKCTSLSKEQNSVISPRSARFIIFALCTPLISDCQQSARVCTKQRFQPEISTYCHFCTGCTTF